MNDNHKLLLSKNVLIIVEERIGKETLSYIQEAIGFLMLRGSVPFPELLLIISTNGGSRGLEIYDILNLYPGKITGLVINNAKSAGALILQACDVRLATPNSHILIHHGRYGEVPFDIIMDDTRLAQFVKDLRRDVEARYTIIVSRTGKSRETIQKLCFEDRDLSVDEALEFGLIDGVWSKPLPESLVDGIKYPA